MTVIGNNDGTHAHTSPSAAGVEVRWSAKTDVGLRRAHNEDSLIAVPPIFAIADGMGGHAHGDVASKAVVDRLAELGGAPTIEPQDIVDALRAATRDLAEGVTDSELGAGTTATGIAFAEREDEPYFAIFNVGDSRVYAYLAGHLTRITVDHSVVQELVDAGLLSQEEAEGHPEANVVTRAVGFNVDPVPDYFLLQVMPGLRLLACSDGLTKEVSDAEIESVLQDLDDTDEAAGRLVELALAHGGRDNVSVIVLDVIQAPTVTDVDRTVPRQSLADGEADDI